MESKTEIDGASRCVPGVSGCVPDEQKRGVRPVRPETVFRTGHRTHPPEDKKSAIADNPRDAPRERIETAREADMIPTHTSTTTQRVMAGEAPRHFGPGWVCLSVSTSPAALRELDAAVLRLKQAGIRKMSRSWLLRIALERLDLDELEADLLEVTR
jgi:hypothetical protein